jgi:type VI secretion system protein ImpL
VTIKTLLFLLFLYICLVWVGAAYLYPDGVREFGLKWTGIGLIAVFVFIVGGHLLNWWRRWRAMPRPQRQKDSPKPAVVVHEDEAALAAALAEANTALAKAPGYTGQRDPIYGLPWRLLIGPQGSGKTSTFLNSEVEPKLLAGQVGETGANAPTRLCNVWLAKNTIFLELGGRVFDGDLVRWTQLLRVVRATQSVPFWRRLLGKREQTISLRGVVAFCDLREFTAASADPQRLERSSRHLHDRLTAIGEVFGARIPVYQVITKCDGIPFFEEFFHQLPEGETRQVLGCTLFHKRSGPAEPGEVFAEVESKRLTKAFRALYQSLADRRLTQLAYENNAALRPAIYEFPRELKRIRGSIVQFLIDAFRPDPLRPCPVLRGYYFTAVREVEMAAQPSARSLDDSHSIVSRVAFAADATHMFKTDNSIPSIDKARSKRMARRWSFVCDLFHRVVLVDQPLQTAVPVDARFELYRRRAFAGVLAFCTVLCLGFLASWIGNRNLVGDIERVAVLPKPVTPVTLEELRNLDALRVQVERLRNGAGWWLHLGLYSGNHVLDVARTAYFRRFQQLLLDDLNRSMTDDLKALPVASAAGPPYDSVYPTLKTHLIISSGNCPVEPAVVSQVLKGVRAETDPQNRSEWQRLSDQQVDFYANELVYGNPVPAAQDAAAVTRGRGYLKNIAGVERIYNAILTEARQNLGKPRGIGEMAPNYTRVLKGGDLPPGFTLEGWTFVAKASRDQKLRLLADCVFGDAGSDIQPETQKQDVAPEIQRLYVRDYIRTYSDFLGGYSVLPYASAGDAAQKLEILSSNRSPLLALVALTANQTHFQNQGSIAVKAVEGFIDKVGKAAGIAKDKQPVPELTGTPAEITQFFQPAHWVVPPDSELLVNERNSAYMDALAGLRAAMQAIANSKDEASRQAANLAAAPAYETGLNAVREISRGFKTNGLDQVIQRLLEHPIRQTRRFIDADPIGPLADKINGGLNQLCKSSGSTFDRYPFRRSSAQDASLPEFSAWFAPLTGHLWKFQSGSLAEYTVLENSVWKQKDPAQKLQVTPEMVAFLNRAQAIVETFYRTGPQPQFTYVLRPQLDSSFKSSTVELEVDGQLHQWTTVFQRAFNWPPAPGTDPGVVARIRTNGVAYAFTSHGGPWAIFRVIADAEPRAAGTTSVEWKYSRTGERRDLIQPAPVRLQFPEFPNKVDIFHPQFFEGIRCPARAVAVQ